MKKVEIIKAKTSIADRGKSRRLDKKLRVGPYCRVSTDDEDQLNSYRSQMEHYSEMVRQNPEWILVDIYADEAITGTKVDKREDFQRLINDCIAGKIDMIITKSISRFARNTLDTLRYVRMLKEKNIAVFFEEENINTLTMDGELLLTILSSVAQQEVENISANVKKGLKMKMQRGELVGFQGCLGYDYDKETKTISINEEEAEIVRYIFRRYLEGAGGCVIAKELRALGYKTKRGYCSWPETTVIGIIKNEKYKGDVLMGKTFTVDPIGKRRLANFGEEDQFYLSEHHEPIISAEVFERAQEIRTKRSAPRRIKIDGNREKYSRKYSFSCLIKCGFCGGALTRRCWHSGTTHSKRVWQCVTATKNGRKYCPDSKGIEESQIEQAFVESYQRMCEDNNEVLDNFLIRVEESLTNDSVSKEIEKIRRELDAHLAKKKKLLDMHLDGLLEKSDFDLKYSEICDKIMSCDVRLADLNEADERRKSVKNRIEEFRKTIQGNKVMTEFDRVVFESIVDHVIIGGYDDDGNKDPELIAFVYKMGFKDTLDGQDFRTPRKVRVSRVTGQKEKTCSSNQNEFDKLCFYNGTDTRRNARLPCAQGKLKARSPRIGVYA